MDSSDPSVVYKSYSAVDFLIGLLITIGASIMNAAGLNITKLDHVRADVLAKTGKRSQDWLRPLWWLGLLLYVISQLVGSTLALQYLRAEYVAPLGSTSLIFNFLFASVLVGTRITRFDIYGTCVIVLGVVGVVGFTQIRQTTSFDKDSNLSLSTLQELWSRPVWLIYLPILEFITIGIFWVAQILNEILRERLDDVRPDPNEDELDEGDIALRRLSSGDGRGGRSRNGASEGGLRGWRVVAWWKAVVARRQILRLWNKKKLETWAEPKPDKMLRKVTALAWSVAGGLLAGQTLFLAKSAVKLLAASFSGAETTNQLASPLSIVIFTLLTVTAVAQVIALNCGLRVFDSTLVVPVFFAVYTASGFINTLIYLDELRVFKVWVMVLVWLSILVLVGGVIMLSSKKTEDSAQEEAKRKAERAKRGLDDEADDEEAGVGLGSGSDRNKLDVPHRPGQGRKRTISSSSVGSGQISLPAEEYDPSGSAATTPNTATSLLGFMKRTRDGLKGKRAVKSGGSSMEMEMGSRTSLPLMAGGAGTNGEAGMGLPNDSQAEGLDGRRDTQWSLGDDDEISEDEDGGKAKEVLRGETDGRRKSDGGTRLGDGGGGGDGDDFGGFIQPPTSHNHPSTTPSP